MRNFHFQIAEVRVHGGSLEYVVDPAFERWISSDPVGGALSRTKRRREECGFVRRRRV